jgi:hypothetical protein
MIFLRKPAERLESDPTGSRATDWGEVGQGDRRGENRESGLDSNGDGDIVRPFQ